MPATIAVRWLWGARDSLCYAAMAWAARVLLREASAPSEPPAAGVDWEPWSSPRVGGWRI